MNFELITGFERIHSLGWEDFVASHPQGTVFQSPVMHELFALTRRMHPVLIAAASRDTGRLAGILLGVTIRELPGLAGYFSSRTVIYGGPLIDPEAKDRREIFRLLLGGLVRKVNNHSIFIQFRNFINQEEFREIFSEYRFHYRDRLNLIVDTSSRDSIIRNMSVSRYRQVKKGLAMSDGKTGRREDGRNLGARIIEPHDLGQVREFYNILQDLYRHKVKKPLPDWDFFGNFYRLSKEGRLGTIQLVEYQGKIVGGILAPVTPGKTIYEWYVCGLDQDFREVYPSVLATWAALDFAASHDIHRFDFMGVGIPEREYGVRDFKARFGGEMVNYGRFARINNRLFYVISEIGYNIITLLKKI